MNKLIPWSERIKGARDMLVMLNRRMYLNTAHTPKLSNAEKIMRSAVVQLMLDDKTNIDRFLNEDEIVFYDWEKDKKGKPIKCKARFMTSIRKTKKFFKSIPTYKDSGKFKCVVEFRGIIHYRLESALIHLKQINAESAFKKRCIRNLRMRKLYCNPLKYGKHKKDKESVEA